MTQPHQIHHDDQITTHALSYFLRKYSDVPILVDIDGQLHPLMDAIYSHTLNGIVLFTRTEDADDHESHE